jgi:hypothetical protein
MALRRTHRVLTVRDLLEIEEDPRRWVVPNMVPRAQTTLVFGHGGSYKSTIVFDLSVAVASQSNMLFQQRTYNETTGQQIIVGFDVLLHGPVLLVSTEGNIYESKRRILAHARAHDVNPADLQLHFCQDPFLMDDQLDVVELESWIKDIKPVLVVLDPLDSFFSGEENSAKDTKPVRREITRLVKDHDTGFIIIHHAAKDQNRSSPRGSSAWFGWADAVLEVVKKSKKLPGMQQRVDIFTVNAKKQRGGKAGQVISCIPSFDEVLDTVTCSFYDGKDLSGVVKTYAKKAVYAVLRDATEGMTNQMVAERLGLRAEQVGEALASLELDGLAARDTFVERPFGPGATRTRRISAWRAVVKKSVVDLAVSMVKTERKAEEEFLRAYTVGLDDGTDDRNPRSLRLVGAEP